MQNSAQTISVIVPVAEGDSAWYDLLADLQGLNCDDEILLSSWTPLAAELERATSGLQIACPIRCILSEKGRARQMNAAAREAQSDFLWFVHADTRLDANSLALLRTAIQKEPSSLHFFNLRFLQDGPGLMKVNSFGVWLRSHLLRLPFGDQGLCVHRKTFSLLESYNEKVSAGEDHLFVWRAHQLEVPVSGVPSILSTSARKYQQRGWGRTTALHLQVTASQALPELFKLLRTRFLRLARASKTKGHS